MLITLFVCTKNWSTQQKIVYFSSTIMNSIKSYGWLCLLLVFKVSSVFCTTPPNVILILTDDQDLILGGMVIEYNLRTTKTFINKCVFHCNQFPCIIDTNDKHFATIGQSGCYIYKCGRYSRIAPLQLQLQVNKLQLNRIFTVYIIANMLSIACINLNRPVCAQSFNEKQFRFGWMLQSKLAEKFRN